MPSSFRFFLRVKVLTWTVDSRSCNVSAHVDFDDCQALSCSLAVADVVKVFIFISTVISSSAWVSLLAIMCVVWPFEWPIFVAFDW